VVSLAQYTFREQEFMLTCSSLLCAPAHSLAYSNLSCSDLQSRFKEVGAGVDLGSFHDSIFWYDLNLDGQVPMHFVPWIFWASSKSLWPTPTSRNLRFVRSVFSAHLLAISIFLM
jgi:hypothetical protein